MQMISFDTLKFVETLEASGFTQKQSRALSTVVREVHAHSDVATKEDIREVKRDVLDLRKDVDTKFVVQQAEIASVRAELSTIRWILGLIGGGVITLVVKALWPM
jgi:hypothetical protein